MKPSELETEVLKLDPPARVRLAALLLESLDGLSEAEVERLWLDEAERRDREMATGAVTPVPAEEVLSELRSRLR